MSETWTKSVWDELKDKVDNEDRKGDDNSQCVLFPAQTVWGDSEGRTSNGDDDELEYHDDGPDHNESVVGANSSKHVEFIMDLS